ncbi:unnamed protein product [Auanema sp. JU1783]|nr:unnamed protein product [Auanema sp. JU1783]
MSRLLRLGHIRQLATSSLRGERAQDITRVPLSVPLQKFADNKGKAPAAWELKPFQTEISKTESGIRIATEPHFGEYCTIGIVIDSGARYECGYPLGTSHLIEKLAFGSTLKHLSRDDIYGVLEKNGALIDCQSTKDTFLYAASCLSSGLDEVMEILCNAIWRPRITHEEFEEAKTIIVYENQDMAQRIECEPLLTDWIHTAAFRDNTLGFSKYTSDETLDKITMKHVFSYMSQYHSPERIVVSGVGVSHQDLKAAVQKHLDWKTTTWSKNPDLLLPNVPSIDNSISQYTGGEVRMEKDLSKLAVGTPYPNLAHVVLGFQGVGYKDDDFVAFCVLQSLLGGGGSFSAGGPGKGMYTRLYTEVMNRCYWVYAATAFNHSYADGGLFCIQASSDPAMINNVLIVLFDQFLRLLQGVHKEELDRAKIQLKSQLMMNLEIRPVMFEDMSRQVMGHGTRRKPDEYMEKIDLVTNKDIIRVAERMMSHRPSLVGYGDIKLLSSYQALDDAVARKSIDELKQKKKVFSWQ